MHRPEPTTVSGGFRPKKVSTEEVKKAVLFKASSTSSLLAPQMEKVEAVARSATGIGGGFRPRPELLEKAQAAIREKQLMQKLSSALDDKRPSLDDMFDGSATPPVNATKTLARRPSGLSGPALLMKTPSSSSGAFRPRKVDAPLPVPATPPPTPVRATAAAKEEEDAYDPLAQYARDAKWFARSYGTIPEASDEKKLEVKHQVNKLLKGTSTKMTREILEDEDETAAAPLVKAKSVNPTPKNGNGHAQPDVAAVLAAKDAANAELTLALAAAEKRNAQLMERLTSMQTTVAELAEAVRAKMSESAAVPAPAEEAKAAPVKEEAKKEDDNPMAGVMKGIAGFFGQNNNNNK